VRYFRHPKMNIITIKAEDMPAQLAEEFGLVPDTHEGKANWFKIVVMEHVEIEMLKAFTDKLASYRNKLN
jgi:tyrosine decarboxylase/aspartate 1-decarboxylase